MKLGKSTIPVSGQTADIIDELKEGKDGEKQI